MLEDHCSVTLTRCFFFTSQFKAVRNARGQEASAQEFKPEPTAEIDVELSDGETDGLQKKSAVKNKLRESDDEALSESDGSHEPGAQGKSGTGTIE